MKRFNAIVVTVMALGLLWNCGSAKSAEAIGVKKRQFAALKELVATKYFVFNAANAYPLQTNAVMQVTNALLRNTGSSGSRISLLGNRDYIKINGDSVQSELAYYGEVRIVSSLDPRDSGIHFEGVPASFEVTENEKKQTIKLRFEIKSTSDLYSVIMQLYPNKRATVFINSQTRTSIRYDGNLKALKETKTSLR